jgi:hypothetical protein
MYNRQQRRKIEKELGILKDYSKKTEKEKAEIRRARIAKGNQLHTKNTQELEEKQAERETLRFQERITTLRKANYSIEEATKIAETEYEEMEQAAMRKKVRGQNSRTI